MAPWCAEATGPQVEAAAVQEGAMQGRGRAGMAGQQAPISASGHPSQGRGGQVARMAGLLYS